MKYLPLLLALLLSAALCAFGQGINPGAAQAPANPGGGRMMNMFGMGGITSRSLMVSTDKGIFIMRDGVLARFDAKTLQQVGQSLQLFGDAPAQPQAGDRAAWQTWMQAMAKRMAPAIIVPKGDDLLVVIGDGFARINQDTFAVAAKADLTLPVLPGAPANQPARATATVPEYLLQDNTLFLMRATELLSLNITDGKIITRNPLPKELLPAAMPNFGGGNRNGAGRNGAGRNGGGRNGGGGNAPAGAAAAPAK